MTFQRQADESLSLPRTSVEINPLPNGHVLVGYWQNWQSDIAGFMRLDRVPESYDVVHVAFAVADPCGDGSMRFTPDPASPVSQFKADVNGLRARGRKVVLSVGGANGSLPIDSAARRARFVASLTALVEEYGFDGIDINLEKVVRLEAGDDDFRRPASPSIVHLIAALGELRHRFGREFVLALAPETISIQGGYVSYREAYGSYLPIIHALRDQLTYVSVQHYNSGRRAALDGRIYSQGRADFHVAMGEMLLQGFPVAGRPEAFFPPLPAEKVVIGLPASARLADDGYTEPAEVRKALNYLAAGRAFGGEYILRQPRGYPNIRGVMAWSINWDAAGGFEFSDAMRRSLDALS